jgi:hypothetical protein
MNITSLLDYADMGGFQLPPFTRYFTWTDVQVISLINSLYLGYPIGGFILDSGQPLRSHETGRREDILVDGVQRVVAIYSTLRGRLPQFLSDGRLPCRLCFDLDCEKFVVRDEVMTGNPRYISLVEFFTPRSTEIGKVVAGLYASSEGGKRFEENLCRAHRLASIAEHRLCIQHMPAGATPQARERVHHIANGDKDLLVPVGES